MAQFLNMVGAPTPLYPPMAGSKGQMMVMGNHLYVDNGQMWVNANSFSYPAYRAAGNTNVTAVANDHPVAFWTFDSSGQLTMYPNYQLNSLFGNYPLSLGAGNAGTFVAGLSNSTGGNALQLDGTAYYSAALDDAFQAINPTSYTFEFWCQYTSTSTMTILGSGNSVNGLLIQAVNDVANARYGIMLSQRSNRRMFLSSNLTNDGAIHHVAVVVNGAASGIWIDGVQQASADMSAALTPLSWANNFRIGQGYTGVLDDIAYYAYPLTQAQIQAHYALKV